MYYIYNNSNIPYRSTKNSSIKYSISKHVKFYVQWTFKTNKADIHQKYASVLILAIIIRPKIVTFDHVLIPN